MRLCFSVGTSLNVYWSGPSGILWIWARTMVRQWAGFEMQWNRLTRPARLESHGTVPICNFLSEGWTPATILIDCNGVHTFYEMCGGSANSKGSLEYSPGSVGWYIDFWGYVSWLGQPWNQPHWLPQCFHSAHRLEGLSQSDASYSCLTHIYQWDSSDQRAGAFQFNNIQLTTRDNSGPLATILPLILNALIESVSGSTIKFELQIQICS